MRSRTVTILGALAVAAGIVATPIGGDAAAADRTVRLKGVLESGHFDDFEHGRAVYFAYLHRKGERIPIVIRRPKAGLRPAARPRVTGEVLQAFNGARVEVTGRWRNGRLLVTTVEARGPQRPRALAVTTGARRVAVFLFNFTNDRSEPFTKDAVRATVFTNGHSVNAFYQQDSFGDTWLRGKVRADGDVFGWFRLNRSNAPCDYWGWAEAARARARENGHDLSGYDHHIFMFPQTSACGWAGLGMISGQESWINGSWLSVFTIAHELGHNLGAHHASTWSCYSGSTRTRVQVSDTCVLGEYGDPFDVMGSGTRLHSNRHRVQIGFLPSYTTYEITQPDVYVTLYSTASTLPIPTLIRVRRPGAVGDYYPYYYIEYRRPYGTYDDFAPTDPAVNGVLIRAAADYGVPETQYNHPVLLDATPETSHFHDAALPVGRIFRDPAGLTIETVATYPDRAIVRVRRGGCL